jgi:hypothetical protein
MVTEPFEQVAVELPVVGAVESVTVAEVRWLPPA